jgi:hypothetical protein
VLLQQNGSFSRRNGAFEHGKKAQILHQNSAKVREYCGYPSKKAFEIPCILL